jgi:hypothetical protein
MICSPLRNLDSGLFVWMQESVPPSTSSGGLVDPNGHEAVLTSDAENFNIHARLNAYEGERRIILKTGMR